MARVAFRALKTRNDVAIAVHDGGHNSGRAGKFAAVRARIDGLHVQSATHMAFHSSVVTPSAA